MDLKFSGIVVVNEFIGMSEGIFHRTFSKEMVNRIVTTFWTCNLRHVQLCHILKFVKTLRSSQEAFCML